MLRKTEARDSKRLEPYYESMEAVDEYTFKITTDGLGFTIDIYIPMEGGKHFSGQCLP